MSVVYELMFPNRKRYIGVARDAGIRWNSHVHHARRGSRLPVHTAIRHYGEAAVKRTVLLSGSADYVRDMEVSCIAEFNTRAPFGYNVSSGGEASPALSVEAREKIRQSKLRHWADPAYRARISAASSAHVHTPEQCAKNAEAKRRQWKDPAYRAKVTAAHAGKKQSQETKQKRAAALRGHPPSNTDQPHGVDGRFVRKVKS